jgi:hypothetical protein
MSDQTPALTYPHCGHAFQLALTPLTAEEQFDAIGRAQAAAAQAALHELHQRILTGFTRHQWSEDQAATWLYAEYQVRQVAALPADKAQAAVDKLLKLWETRKAQAGGARR